MLVPCKTDEKTACAEGDGTYGKEHVCHVLLHSSWIGNDVYCDTSLIASVLETRFPVSEGYGTLFPPRKGGGKADTGLVKAFSVYYAAKVVFPLGAMSLPYAKLGEKFLADRSAVSVIKCWILLRWTVMLMLVLLSGKANRSTRRLSQRSRASVRVHWHRIL